MNKLKNKFMNITIRSKMVWSYIVASLIPFCVFGMIGISVFTGQAKKSVSQHADQMMSQVKTSIDVYVNSIDKIANFIICRMENTDYGSMKTEDNVFWKQEKLILENTLDDLAFSNKEIAGIFVATENDLCTNTGMRRISRDSFKNEDWYRQAAANPDEMQIISNIAGRNIATDKSYSIDDVFSIAKAIKNADTGEIMGVMLLDIKHDIISKYIQNVTIGDNGFVFVLDKNDRMDYTLPNKVTYRIDPAWLTPEQVPVDARINGENYQIRYEESEYTGWKIVGVFSLDEIMGSTNAMFYILSGGLAMTLIFVLVISLKISQTITNPIVELKLLMREVASGNLAVRFEGNYNDEVSELGYGFNHMLVQIESLVDMVYVEQKNKRMAELKVLQEQIKPHFLYNTLDTISWMAREYQADDIVRLVDALTNMFRIGLSKGRDYIKVEQEIKYVSNYLYIQKIRYGPKLNYELLVDDSLDQCVVPKLMLQPLVENAIYHGIKTKRGEGHLIIRCESAADNWMEFTVEDDGAGMTQEKAEQINALLNEHSQLEENQSFGLFYIKERLRIRYGDKFCVRVTSELGAGTKVIILIPQSVDLLEGGNRDEK